MDINRIVILGAIVLSAGINAFGIIYAIKIVDKE